MSRGVSASLSLCKCAYMRGLAFRAPTQTISLFWKCLLKSSGADRSQEQRGKRALTSFLLSLQAFPLQFLCQLASKTLPEACRGLEKKNPRSKPWARGSWRLGQAVCHFPRVFVHLSDTYRTPSIRDVHPNRLLLWWSPRIARGLQHRDRTGRSSLHSEVWTCNTEALHALKRRIFFSYLWKMKDESSIL